MGRVSCFGVGGTIKGLLSAVAILSSAGCASTSDAPVASIDQIAPERVPDVLDPRSENFLQAMIEEEKFSGVALVRQGDEIVHARAYGMADDTRTNSLGMAFHVGSITKQFTAVAIMRLVEMGEIELEGHINEYLPEYLRSEQWNDVQVQHLLSHTSGIPDYGTERDYYEVVDGWPNADTMDGMLREAMQSGPEFEPGTDFEYSNIGYTLLGVIIEQSTGMSYADFVETELLGVAGMTQSRIHRLDHVASANEPQGNRWNATEDRHTKDMVVTLPVTPADGGLITTLSDFLKWVDVYRFSTPDLISIGSVSRMARPAIPAGSYDWKDENIRGDASYGFGLTLSGDLIMHEGFIVGYRSYFIYSRADDLLIAVFTNNTTNSPQRIAQGLFLLNEPQVIREANLQHASR